ncbi:MAG: 6-phosphogluconolactonase [Actinobacteria bacterium]|nr:6-phosphogluconolactonase [Actinomycetota bacterium]
MSFETVVFPNASYPQEAAQLVAGTVEGADSVVLTGGTTAENVYAELTRHRVAWSRLTVLFSDERCVPPGDPASNYGMAERLLFQNDTPHVLHRMRGEDPPEHAADQYHSSIQPVVADGLDVMLLGMGADAHICAMFPGSRAVDETTKLCVAVNRPDGMMGLTLTPPAVLSARKILLIVTGEGKAATVKRVIDGGESPSSAPARMLAAHEDVTVVLDEGAASAL